MRTALPAIPLLVALVTSAQTSPVKVPPPRTRVEAVAENFGGVAVEDPYRWLEDQKSPETRAWINEQNRYTQSILGSLPGRETVRRRIEQLLKIDTINTPIARGDRYFFSKRLADQSQPVIYLRQGLRGPDQVLVDPNKLSADRSSSVFISDVSEDGKLLAYATRQGGADEVSITLLDVDARREMPDRLPSARYSGFSIKPDRGGFYYARSITDGAGNYTGSRVYYHRMGTAISRDEEMFGKGYGPTEIVIPRLSDDGRYLAIYVLHGSSKTDVFIKNLETDGPIRPLAKDIDASFDGEIAHDRMYLLTNLQTPHRRILEVDLKRPEREHWREIIPETDSVISTFSLAGGHLFVNYLERVSSRIKVFDAEGKHVRDINLPSIGSASDVAGRWDRDEAFYSFNSFAQPNTIYRYQVSTGRQEVWARIKVPVEGERIEIKQVWYDSKDGVKIPMFLVSRKGMKQDGMRPTLMTGYGGFNVSRTPDYSAQAAFWVEQGGLFALPNLRGGGEFGEKWHKAGMLDRKQKVFDDFIAAAEWLIKNRYTNPSKLAIMGRSNGGLLVGAALTQRPDLFQAVSCGYPLLDMLRYHRFLVARFWVPEYGSAENPQQFGYLRRYSPYHNVRDGERYPAVLFTTGDSDTRVAPLHARKMTARLQAATRSERPILLRYDTKAGHSSGQPVSKQVEDLTDEMVFLLWQLRVTPR